MATTPSNQKFALSTTTWTEIVPSIIYSGGVSAGIRKRKVVGLWVYNPNTTNVIINGRLTDTSGDFDTPDNSWDMFVRELEQDTNWVMPSEEGFFLEDDERFMMKLSSAAASDVTVVASVIDL